MNEKYILVLFFFSLIIIFSFYLTKALGLRDYEDEEKSKEYEKWLEKEGKPKTIMIILILCVLFYCLFFVLLNFQG